MDRRKFFRLASATGASLAAGAIMGKPLLAAAAPEDNPQNQPQGKPATNIADALNYPRTANSMPGRYPAKVVQVINPNAVVDNVPVESVAYAMLAQSMLALTGQKNLKKAWRQFVGPKEIIGLKVNPIGGAVLSTSHAVVKSTIKQLEEAGIPRTNIVIWDRREDGLIEAGFTAENYPGIRIVGTEHQVNGTFYGADGKLLSEGRIDKDWYYWADCEETYNAYTIPYMVNEGKYSYFTKICTQDIDKIINMPIMKNANAAITLCLKNLAYGVLTNTARLHKQLWAETSAQACAFPPIRDKAVLNIADGLLGCYDGGPAANPQFICQYNMLLVGTDAVAVDRIAHDIIIGKRIAEGRQKEDSPKGIAKLTMAQEYGLGIADKEKIQLLELKA